MPRRTALLIAGVATGLLVAGGATLYGPLDDAAEARAAAGRIVNDADVAAARRYAKTRRGAVAFAVVAARGDRPRGLNANVQYPSASVSKAMLLVAALRRAGSHPIPAGIRARLRPMITESDNRAATVIYRMVGGGGLRAVAKAARMTRFGETGHWASARVTAADQARLFYRIDRLVPRTHREYARKLLSSIVPHQRWGIARAAGERYRVFLKGGWRKNINHQIALLERDDRRIAIAVLTNEDGAYGRRTEEGVARILLRSDERRR